MKCMPPLHIQFLPKKRCEAYWLKIFKENWPIIDYPLSYPDPMENLRKTDLKNKKTNKGFKENKTKCSSRQDAISL